MKTTVFALCITLSLGALSLAQQPLPPAKAARPVTENYVVTLTSTDREQKTSTLSLVVASADFNTNFVDAQSNVTKFVGTLAPEDGGIVYVQYVLGGEISVSVPNGSTMYKSVGTQATVRLKLGEPVQILKSDSQTCTLKIARLSEEGANGK